MTKLQVHKGRDRDQAPESCQKERNLGCGAHPQPRASMQSHPFCKEEKQNSRRGREEQPHEDVGWDIAPRQIGQHRRYDQGYWDTEENLLCDRSASKAEYIGRPGKSIARREEKQGENGKDRNDGHRVSQCAVMNQMQSLSVDRRRPQK
ncbi:MAG: hypothetical protein ACYCO5_10890 [Acidobacteriaceae bacterium]